MTIREYLKSRMRASNTTREIVKTTQMERILIKIQLAIN